MFWFIPLAWILQVTESPVAVVVALANVTVKSFDPSGPVSKILLYTGVVLLEWATTYFLATDVAVLVSEVNHTSNIKVPVVALFNVKVRAALPVVTAWSPWNIPPPPPLEGVVITLPDESTSKLYAAVPDLAELYSLNWI